MSPSISFRVLGVAPVGGGRTRWTWRERLAREARRHRAGVRGVGPDTSFALDVVFYLVPGRFERADLDNLAKPVLDTLFVSKDVQVRSEELTGALCQLDDGQVWRLRAEKRPVEDVAKEGVEVRVTWR